MHGDSLPYRTILFGLDIPDDLLEHELSLESMSLGHVPWRGGGCFVGVNLARRDAPFIIGSAANANKLHQTPILRLSTGIHFTLLYIAVLQQPYRGGGRALVRSIFVEAFM